MRKLYEHFENLNTQKYKKKKICKTTYNVQERILVLEYLQDKIYLYKGFASLIALRKI